MSVPTRNPLRSRIEGSEQLLGGWCTLPTSFAAELVASSGVDYAVIDLQHGLTGYSDLVSMLQAISLAGAVPLVRIPFGDYGMAQRALDAGAMGVVFPMVNTPELARIAVDCCRYPPLGERSFGPIRSKFNLGTDPAWVNSQILCLVQIDGVYVGPADLALSHGLAVGKPSIELDELLRRIHEACVGHGKIPAIHTTSGADCLEKIALGYRMCSIGSDSVWLHAAYTEEVAKARNAVAISAGDLY